MKGDMWLLGQLLSQLWLLCCRGVEKAYRVILQELRGRDPR